MSRRIVLDINLLKKTFSYRDGALYWKVSSVRGGAQFKPGDRAGFFDSLGYRKVKCGGKYVLEHRAIFAIVNGRWPRNNLDHIDGNPSNNEISNLRECDQSLNMQNSGVRSDNKTTGIRGVHFHKRTGKFIAQLRVKGKHTIYKSFQSLREAVFYRKEIERKHHPFSPLNSP